MLKTLTDGHWRRTFYVARAQRFAFARCKIPSDVAIGQLTHYSCKTFSFGLNVGRYGGQAARQRIVVETVGTREQRRCERFTVFAAVCHMRIAIDTVAL